MPGSRHITARPSICAAGDERRQAIAQAADQAGRTGDLLACHGIECPTLSGAGTGSFEFEGASGVYTKLQCGSYTFTDADYGNNPDRHGGPFEPSLHVWAAVMSRPAEDRAIAEAGLKPLALDFGPPLVRDEPAATCKRATSTAGAAFRPPPISSGSATRSA